ncbi:hypothetical protein ABVF61_27855 [Roseibium sp. HPY-6]|uniref:hypothetical protein n=1 Tax=Roseibium sp. HPY-6 TaxID=3229852 RepID=UPI00338EABFB
MVGLLRKLDSYGYLVGVISAALILLSWMAKEIVGAQARTVETTMRSVVNSRTDDQFDGIVLRLQNIEKAILRSATEGSASLDDNDYFTEVIWNTEVLSKLQLLFDDFGALAVRVERVRHEALAVPLGDNEKRLQKLVQETNDRLSQLIQLRAGFDEQLTSIIGSASISRNTVTPDKVASLTSLVDQYEVAFMKEYEPYLTLTNSMLSLRELVYAKAESRAREYSFMATLSEVFAAIVFLLGSVIGIYGTYREAMAKASERTRQQDG